MYVVEVIPIGRGISADTLSYFSSTPHPRGSLLSVPLRSKNAPAVVVGTTEVSTMKTALRAATFTLRRLPEQDAGGHLGSEFLRTVDHVATFFASSSGAALFALLPKEVRSGAVSLFSYTQTPRPSLPREDMPREIFQAKTSERFIEYARLVRESFANHSSVLFVTPTLEHARQVHEALKGGIEDHALLFHSMCGAKALGDAYRRVNESIHPLLIVTTPQYAFFERSDIGVTVIESSRSGGYVQHARPYVDYRHALLFHNKLHRRRIIISDTLIRSEDEHALRTQEAVAYGEHPKRIELPGRLRVVSMKSDPDGTQGFSLFSIELIKRLRQAREQKERTFLFAARRGLAPVVACADCGHIMRSPESGAPLSLHRRVRGGIEERWFVCSVSGYRERAKDTCPSCGGWRLKERGIGIQQVYDEFREGFPDAAVTLFDHTTANTPKKAAALRDAFYKEKGGVMIGTMLALPYLTKPVSFSAIVSVDSLKAIPSWRQQEEALGVILSLREKTEGTVLVQTRSEDDGLLAYAEKGATQSFYDHELSLRESYNYPPFATFIHLAWQGTEHGAKKLEATITERFAPYNVALYGAPDEAEGKTVRYGLIRVPAREWPQKDILSNLRSLPPAVRIMVNPERIV